jgi:hypothetical protein
MTHETYSILATTNSGIYMDTLVKSKSLPETSNSM